MADPSTDTPDDVAAALAVYNDPSKSMAQRVGLLGYTQEEPTQKQLSPQSTGNYGPPPVYSQPPAPRLQNIPQPIQTPEPNPFEVFKNPVVALSIIGSLFTRRPLVAAMGAAGSAMTAQRQNQQDQFNQNKEQFHEQLEQAVAQNRMELEKYQVNLDRSKTENWNKILPDMWAHAAANKDEFMMQMLRLGPEMAEKAILMREQAQNSVYKAIEVEDARNLARDQEVKRLKEDPGVIAQAEAVRKYEQPPPPQGRTNLRNQAIQELVTERSDAAGESYQTAGYGAKQAFTTGLGKTTPGTPGGQVNSAKIVIRHLATLDRLIDDLGSGNAAMFRRAAQALQTQFGWSSAPTNFDAAVSLISGEIVKLVEGAGGTGGDRDKVSSAFNRANSGPLLHDAVDVSREVMSARVDTLAEQAKGAHAESEFNRYLPPDIQGLLKPRGAGASSGKSGFDVEDFRRKAKAKGVSDAEIDKFLSEKGH